MTATSTPLPSRSLLSRIDRVLQQEDWTASASFAQPARAAVSASLPAGLLPHLQQRLNATYPQGIYRHQALALELMLTGADVALTTPTASGKSLVFITGALHILLADPSAKVVALYPMKALGNDQFTKWKAALDSSGLNVAVLDGDVKVKDRERLLEENQVLIMTPDVLHTWMMAHLHSPVVRRFRDQLRLVILDEAHVYDGVFGTSTAYLLRRLDACGPHFQLIASSATIGQVDSFLTQLTGRTLSLVSAAEDGSPKQHVAWRSITPPAGNAFKNRVDLLMGLVDAGIRFIAFADSRKSAELLASATRRGGAAPEASDEDFIAEADDLLSAPGILPYRSGIEAKDRQRIEAALASGELRGVIATSALELGVDIPGINCVVLMGSPPTQKSLWQRAGRTGRHGEGCVLLIQDAPSLGHASLSDYLARPIEANHLSLENRSLEFAHVLCATIEAEACGTSWNTSALSSLSRRFRSLLEGERAGGQVLEQDLWDLKSKAGGAPHRTFSLRSGKETSFEILLHHDRIGSISLPQVMRETYPGAIYYHLATPYRVRCVKRNKGVIDVSPERRYTTTPILQSTVFVTLRQAESLRSGPDGFLYSGEIQSTERVTGFRERRGSRTDVELYGPGSPYSQTPFDRWLRSTGVCWTLTTGEPMAEACGERLLAAFCSRFGVCRGDLGLGRFRCQQNPYGPSPVTGLSIYDRIEGGLRLTDELFQHFPEIATAAADQALSEAAEPQVIQTLQQLARAAATWSTQASPSPATDIPATAADMVEVFQPNSPVLYRHQDHHEEVRILTFLPKPEGLEYLVTLAHGGTKSIKAPWLHPIDGVSQTMLIPQAILQSSISVA